MTIRIARNVRVLVSPASRLDMENLAEEYLHDLAPTNLMIPSTVDIISLLDDLEEYDGVVFGVEELPSEEEGYTDPIAREIIVSRMVYRGAMEGNGRDRMTCAHEVGHIQHIPQINALLRRGRKALGEHLNRRAPVYCDPEWQASAFASALLMPRKMATSVHRSGGVDALCQCFGVTKSAAQTRIRVLGKLGLLTAEAHPSGLKGGHC